MTATRQPPARRGDVAADSFWYGVALWTALLVFIGGVAIVTDRATSSTVEIIAIDVVAAAIVGIFAWRVRGSIRKLFDHSGLVPRELLVSAGVFAAMVGFQWVYHAAATWLGFRYISPVASYAIPNWPLWAILIDVALIPAVMEEIAFRGVVQSGLEGVMSRRDALIVQAAMFSVLHLLPAVFISHFVIGLGLGFVRLRTGSVYPGMILHCAWNAYVVVTS